MMCRRHVHFCRRPSAAGRCNDGSGGSACKQRTPSYRSSTYSGCHTASCCCACCTCACCTCACCTCACCTCACCTCALLHLRLLHLRLLRLRLRRPAAPPAAPAAPPAEPPVAAPLVPAPAAPAWAKTWMGNKKAISSTRKQTKTKLFTTHPPSQRHVKVFNTILMHILINCVLVLHQENRLSRFVLTLGPFLHQVRK